MKIAAVLYIGAMLAANLIVAKLGPWVSPILAFVLIGFDLTMRDWLQVRIKPWQMGHGTKGAALPRDSPLPGLPPWKTWRPRG